MMCDSIFTILECGDYNVSFNDKSLRPSAAAFSANGQSIVEKVSGQCCCAWSRIVRDIRVNSWCHVLQLRFQNVLQHRKRKYFGGILSRSQENCDPQIVHCPLCNAQILWMYVAYTRLHAALATSVFSVDRERIRCTYRNCVAWLTKTVAPVIQADVRVPVIWGISPSCAETSWSVDTPSPGSVSLALLIEPPGEPFVGHGHLCALPKAQPEHFGTVFIFAKDAASLIIPKCWRWWNLLYQCIYSSSCRVSFFGHTKSSSRFRDASMSWLKCSAVLGIMPISHDPCNRSWQQWSCRCLDKLCTRGSSFRRS